MRIGNLELEGNVVLAPMAGITDPPFRRIVQRFGVSALWTEMISAEGVLASRGTPTTLDLRGHQSPTFFQIHGKDPISMSEAARRLQGLGAAAVDINMGCPARRVVGRGAGAALMKDLSLAGRIVAAVRKALAVPLTVKIRAGWDEENRNAAAVAHVIEEEGADAVIVHGRYRSQTHSGPSSFSVVAEVKQTVKIPVIGNGGILTAGDAVAMVEQTGCDGVMVGRGALGRPWLPGKILAGPFSRLRDCGEAVTYLEVIREHFRAHLDLWDVFTAVHRMRKHLGWYSKGFFGGAEFRRSVFREEDPVRIMDSVEQFFGKAVVS